VALNISQLMRSSGTASVLFSHKCPLWWQRRRLLN